MAKVYIGTSGWSYKYWKGPFYPVGLPHNRFFSYYQQYFSTVELNNPFYRLPSEKTIMQWRESSPDDFIFAVKASRFITHIKRLKDCQGITKFIEPIKLLENKLGPILFQLPANFKVDLVRLEEFLKYLPEGFRYVFELRNTNWFINEVYEILEKYNTAFCIYDFNGTLSPVVATADFVYIRLHGNQGKYNGDYSNQELTYWADIISNYEKSGKDVYCYFDNDTAGFAPKNARELLNIYNSL